MRSYCLFYCREDLLASLRGQIAEENDKEREQQQQQSEQVTDNDNEQAAEESGSSMPTGLSTPVDVVSSNLPKKKKKKKKKKSKTANLPEAGSEIPDNYQEKYNEDVIDNPYDP